MSDIINYSNLIDGAMHVIVRKSLELLSSTPSNLLGNHHFFISFITTHPEVVLSPKLIQRYPKEMTIVLQYQFEELQVNEDGFSVVLSFDNVKGRIEVPFAAITAFADPSVKFGLQFRHVESPSISHAISPHTEASPNSEEDIHNKKDIHDIIKESGATNVITLDSFRKKPNNHN